MDGGGTHVLKVTGLVKNFGAVHALKDASLSIEIGEIRALLGANGSGKSTFVKVLSGINKKDGGSIQLEGKELNITSPITSIQNGIAMAYQDLSLIPRLSVAENMVIGYEPIKKNGTIDRKSMLNYAEKMIEELGIRAYPDVMTENIDLSNKGLIEIAKALYMNPKLLIMDEITASMHHDQVERLFAYLRKRVMGGLSIIFVSHRFEEVYDFCTTATILREGISVADLKLLNSTPDELVYHMTGKKTAGIQHENVSNEVSDSEARLLVDQMNVLSFAKNISIYVGKGEVVGIAGLQGQGQGEFLRALFGAISYNGNIVLDGANIRIKSPSDAIRKGIGFISGDREKEGIFSTRAVSENILITETALRKLPIMLSVRKEREKAEQIMKELNVVAAGAGVPANSLSGGNQQKLIVGRWLYRKPKVLLLDDPTKGVDVNSRNEINSLLKNMTKTGMSILYSSSDNEELLRVAERIYVFYEGKIIKELKGKDKNSELLAATMLGVDKEAKDGKE